jgi:hypothetical protein
MNTEIRAVIVEWRKARGRRKWIEDGAKSKPLWEFVFVI